MASRTHTSSSSKIMGGRTPRSTGCSSPRFPSSQEAVATPVYSKVSRSAQKRKVVDLTEENEEDEEAEALAQAALAGEISFFLFEFDFVIRLVLLGTIALPQCSTPR